MIGLRITIRTVLLLVGMLKLVASEWLLVSGMCSALASNRIKQYLSVHSLYCEVLCEKLRTRQLRNQSLEKHSYLSFKSGWR